MDVLTDVLESIRIRSVVIGRFELSAPWGFVGEGFGLGFCVVTRGSCWLEMDGARAVSLGSGDFVLMRKNRRHTLRDSLRTPAQPIHDILKGCRRRHACQPGGVFTLGGGGAQTTIVGGRFEIDEGLDNPLLASLPPMIHVRGDRGTPVQWLESTLQFMAAEMASGQPGAETVVSRLADILFVQAVRTHVAEGGDRAGWVQALVDPQIGQALSLIHQQPQHAWTVESLAARVAMSRSAFAARFVELVREPPMTYLTRWRMTTASRLLRAGDVRIGDVAGRVGYDAEAAFSKAFKRWTGTAPGAFRRSAAAVESARPRT
jgi:AraC-like DNA-binding protein